METVEDVVKVISEARPTKPFKTVDMTDKFFDFDSVGETYITTKKLGVSSVSLIKVCKDQPNDVLFKKTFFGDWQKCRVLKKV